MIRLGIDLGERRVGLSLHDDDALDARPHATIELRKGDSVVEVLARSIEEARADELVVGLPLRMDGGESLKTRSARSVAAALHAKTGRPVVLWDERLTTVQAQRARTLRGRKGRDGIDAEAAALLLQSYVDSKRGGSGWQGDPEED